MNLLSKTVITSGTFAALLLLTAITPTTARALGAPLSGAVRQIGFPVITTTILPPPARVKDCDSLRRASNLELDFFRSTL